jgi:hypothetical protein
MAGVNIAACKAFNCVGYASIIECTSDTQYCSGHGTCHQLTIDDGVDFVNCTDKSSCFACNACSGNWASSDCGICNYGFDIATECNGCLPGFQRSHGDCETIPPALSSVDIAIIVSMLLAVFGGVVLLIVRHFRRKIVTGDGLGKPLLEHLAGMERGGDMPGHGHVALTQIGGSFKNKEASIMNVLLGRQKQSGQIQLVKLIDPKDLTLQSTIAKGNKMWIMVVHYSEGEITSNKALICMPLHLTICAKL